MHTKSKNTGLAGITAQIDESKHKLVDIIKKQKASSAVVSLLKQFLNKTDAALNAQNKPVIFPVHASGLTGYFDLKVNKAFIFIDIYQKHVSIRCFTGNKSINGLKKANWLKGRDNKGSKTFRIRNDSEVEEAVKFACAAYKITYQNIL